MESNRVPDYAELHCLSNFTFQRGASHPEELVTRAYELGYSALALTDECSVAGVVRAFQIARELPIKLIVGSEFTCADRSFQLVILAPDRHAYGQLCTLITQARRRAEKGRYTLLAQDLETLPLDRCLVLWPVRPTEAVAETGPWLRRLFDGRLWLLAQRHLLSGELQAMQRLSELAKELQLPVAAGGNVHMHLRSRKPIQDVLTALRENCTVANAGTRMLPNAEYHLRTRGALQRLFPLAWLKETLVVAELCTFQLNELRYEYPSELVPTNQSPGDYLRSLVDAGAQQRFPEGLPGHIKAQINHELSLIAELQYEHYFLTLHDIVVFARSRGILCQGRGSAANSVVCYCLGITEVDPRKVDMLFERFVSRNRNEPPDIDVDFEHERREEVIQWLYKRYGRNRAALAAAVITYRPKSALRDVGRALGLDLALVEQLMAGVDWRSQSEPWWEQIHAKGVPNSTGSGTGLIELVRTLIGFPRHLSQHVGGFVISAGPLSQLVPVENAAMPERTVIQWDKTDLENLGLMKVDILALGMLTAIRKALDLTGSYLPKALRIQDIPSEDPAVYSMLSNADSIGVFQVESRAQMNMLPRLKPKTYYDLVIQVAIVRPGPIQGDMVHPYLRRRTGMEDATYPNPAIRKVLERTLGVPIFQEQVIKLAMVAAGFTGGEADQLRRAMAAWKQDGDLEPFRERLLSGMIARGYETTFAERLYEQLRGFGGYGFPESHSASFALLVYVSAWLKRYHPAAFYIALLNSQPMGFYSPRQLIQDARRHDVPVTPVDINESDWDHTLLPNPSAMQSHGIRLGLRLVKGLGREAAGIITARRPIGGYRDTKELIELTQLPERVYEALVGAGALKPIAGDRYHARWELLGIESMDGIFAPLKGPATDLSVRPQRLPSPSEGQNLTEDIRAMGLSLERHPLALLREQGLLRNATTAAELLSCHHGQVATITGLVTGRQRPGSASGVTFLTVEDETGSVNTVVWLATAERQRQALLKATLMMVTGVVERDGDIVHLIAGRLSDKSHLLSSLQRSTPE